MQGKGGRGGEAQVNLSLIASAFSAGGRRRPEASVEMTATEKGGGRNIRAGVDCVKKRLRRQTGGGGRVGRNVFETSSNLRRARCGKNVPFPESGRICSTLDTALKSCSLRVKNQSRLLFSSFHLIRSRLGVKGGRIIFQDSHHASPRS